MGGRLWGSLTTICICFLVIVRGGCCWPWDLPSWSLWGVPWGPQPWERGGSDGPPRTSCCGSGFGI